MKKEELSKLTIEELKGKAQGNKTLIGIFIPIIMGLFYFIIRDYFKGEGIDMATLTIAICSIGGMVSIFPTLKAINNELEKRDSQI